jgi:hypothetical protein
MSRIYKTNSRIEIKVDDISVFISSLSYHQKMSLQVLMLKAANNDMNAAMEAVVQAQTLSKSGSHLSDPESLSIQEIYIKLKKHSQ